jgi:hypothetical protein
MLHSQHFLFVTLSEFVGAATVHTYFHRVCIQSGIVRKKLGFEARCYIILIYLNVGYNIAIYLNVGTIPDTESWLTFFRHF